MANEMSWKECVYEGIITPSVPDDERSNQMLMMANDTLTPTPNDDGTRETIYPPDHSKLYKYAATISLNKLLT